ncbi:hypothetical protein [Maribacter dokdonensis]|uniref:hypothetical protein n=1 Tax=Maribacter dokdonensis TaxID=320912 RepID=UPI002AB26E99|nr:hypothetical protein [Maribacter dokdonensis]
MDTKHYICNYCHEEFIPKRRYVQKFCSATCRSKAHHQKTKAGNLLPLKQVTNNNTKIEKMSAAGIANAAAGTIAADVLKRAFTNNNDKPATKGDILALSQKIERYHRVLNIALGANGELPYFDMVTKQIVYFKIRFPLKIQNFRDLKLKPRINPLHCST